MKIKKIGLSITTEDSKQSDLNSLLKKITEHLMGKAVIVYGGDLRQAGLKDVIQEKSKDLKDGDFYFENHLAWQFHDAEPKVKGWGPGYEGAVKFVYHDIPKDIAYTADKIIFLPDEDILNRYVWSRCLTEMREKSIAVSDARICAGGKNERYMGKMPGVLEEVMIALRMQKPLYLIGGFGGIVKSVCDFLCEPIDYFTLPLIEGWQADHNPGYSELQEMAKQDGHHADYIKIRSDLGCVSIDDLARNSGLTSKECLELMGTVSLDRCVHLISKGLTELGLITP